MSVFMRQMDLGKKALLVGLKVSQWTARKCDQTASEEVWKAHKASGKSGKFNKALLPDCAERVAISQNINDARAFHYANTLPWEDDGFRVLPASNYMKYSAQMAEFKNKNETLVNAFVKKYQKAKTDAKQTLGTLYDESDYPTEAALKDAFSFNVVMRPMVVADDFRCQLGDDEVARIQSEIEGQVKGAMQAAAKDVWERLYDAVKKVAEKMHEPDAIFRDTLIGNIQELVDTLPRLNIMDDPGLTDIIREVKETLAGREPAKLRKDKKERRDAEKAASDILAKMAGYGASADANAEDSTDGGLA